MLFHTQVFLLAFLPPVLAAYYLLAGYRTARLWLLILSSLVFYGYWDVRLLPLLVGSVAVNWGLAQLYSGDRRWLVPLGIAANLAVLGIFKYADFAASNLLATLGLRHDPWSLVLPLGISFFTFQQISYLADLRRGTAGAYRFTDYALYVGFFPQLVAGPIVRHNEIIYQYDAPPLRDGCAERLVRGTTLLVCGIVKKVGIADWLAGIADPIYAGVAAGAAPNLVDAWVAATAFGLQIYFDFSGYSDMAIGLALLFGFTLPANFEAPYRATSIRDFWHRWHMTLSRFLRDYLYIPLGGSRHGPSRMLAALLVTMVLGGLWHGAGWTFVAWGALHGLGLVVNHLWRRAGRQLPDAVGWGLTLVFAMVCWTFFRATDIAGAFTLVAGMSGVNGLGLDSLTDKLWIIPVALVIAAAGPTSQRLALEILTPRQWLAPALATAVVFVLLLVGGGDNKEFIYFQF